MQFLGGAQYKNMKKRLKNSIPIPEDAHLDPFMSLEKWSQISGIKLSTLQQRFKAGWPLEEVFYRKVRYNKANKRKFDECIYEKVGEIEDRSGKEWTRFSRMD